MSREIHENNKNNKLNISLRALRGYFYFIFLLLLFFYGYFVHPVIYDNAATRLDLAYSLPVHRTTRIDAYHRNTLDKAYRDGHYYCDKAPGLSIAAVPVLAAAKFFVRPQLFHPDNISLQYFLILVVISIPSAFTAVLLFKYILVPISSVLSAFMLTISYALGTMAFSYSTLFLDHQFATVLILIGFVVLMPIFIQDSGFRVQGSEGDEKNSKFKIQNSKLFLSGLLFGWAAISEFPSAVSAAIILLFVFIKLKPRAAIVWLLLGGMFPVGVLLLYNTVSFGSPFAIGYFFEAHEYYREGMGAGLAGVTYPKLSALFRLLFLPERGLFWGAPFLLFSVPGFAIMLRRKDWQRMVGSLCLSIVCVRLLIVSSYYEPWGGFAPGPRFLTGCLPFMVIPIAVLWGQMAKTGRHLLVSVCLFSVVYNTILNAVEPQAPAVVRHPVMEYSLALLGKGYMPKTIFDFLNDPLLFFILIAIVSYHIFTRMIGKEKWFIYRLSIAIVVPVLFASYHTVATIIPTGDQPQVKYYLGVALRQNGKLTGAASELLASVRLKPSFPEAHYALGITHVKMGKYEEAERNFSDAIRTGSDDARVYVSLGALYLMTKKYDGADKVLKEGREKFPDSEEIRELSDALERARDGKNERQR
ncbi:MAG: tetratricopeptide repeat protein [bacterium]